MKFCLLEEFDRDFVLCCICVCEQEKKEENVLRTKNVDNRKDFTQLSSLIQRNKKRRKLFYEYIININLKVNLTKLTIFSLQKNKDKPQPKTVTICVMTDKC